MEGGYVVTNAHVVWPFDVARLVFPDGSEFLNAPVRGWDLIADLAVLGPVEAQVPPLELVDGEDLVIGSETYLIGYPGEVESLPQPTITRGLISRLRNLESIGVTYFQTDASISGGQSGGALVSERGKVIGISGFTFGEAGFGLAASSADIATRIENAIAGRDPTNLGDRWVPKAAGDRQHSITLSNWWDERAFVIWASVGTTVRVEVAGAGDKGLAIYDSFGSELVVADEIGTATESASFDVEYDEPHFLVVWQSAETPGTYTVEATDGLAPINDPDDGTSLMFESPIQGSMDYPGDVDYYLVEMREGETLRVTAKSALIDPYLRIDYQGAADEQVIVDDDSGGGLFGLDAEIVYEAPHTGSYFVVVDDPDFEIGGYVLALEPAASGLPVTSTTLAPLVTVNDEPDGVDQVDGYGLVELRSALTGLPPSFEEADPTTSAELGMGDVGLVYDFKEVVYNSADPFSILSVSGGWITEEGEAILGLDGSMSDQMILDLFTEEVVAEFGDEAGEADPEISILDLPSLGDSSIGVSFDLTVDIIRVRMDIAFFRRGDLFAMTWLLYLPSSPPGISIGEVAAMLDISMGEFLSGS